MTNFELFKNMSLCEFTEWLDSFSIHDNAPWVEYFCENYCNKCEPEIAYIPYFNREMECAWCEMHGKCRFFEDMEDTPNTKEIIKMWLESEINNVD